MSNASGGSPAPNTTTAKKKKKRNLPGNPDPDAEVIALSPKSLTAMNRFMCEVCNKGFQRDQNLQLHRRGHNLPWKLKQRSDNVAVVRKKAYVCPEASCVHHHPSRALGDLTGIKKHFSRKHGEKKYKCDKCSKKYAVHSDWKAHSKTCGTREYKCDCGTIFSRRDSFITHRAFCDALAEESVPKSNPYGYPLFFSSSSSTVLLPKELGTAASLDQHHSHYFNNNAWQPTSIDHNTTAAASNINNNYSSPVLEETSAHHENTPLPLASSYQQASAAAANSAHLSATALLQKAAQMGAAISQKNAQIMAPHSVSAPTQSHFKTRSRNEEGGGGGGSDGLTRDFLGLRALSHKDILSIAAAGGLPSTFDQHCQHNNNITNPWHG